MVAQSRKMRNVLEIAGQVARRDSTVLLSGESGTGKELLAKALHQNSLRAGKPFITVNCGALPETLAESELFGHRKGSFTGATADKAGKFETANEGTVFLDEVGDLPLTLQVKLLRVIQEREIDKIGNPRPIKVNVRIVAASNRNLKDLVANIESLMNMHDNPAELNLSIDHVPFVMQYNKRDLPRVVSIEDLERELNPRKVPFFESVAVRGVGVFDTLKSACKLVLKTLG